MPAEAGSIELARSVHSTFFRAMIDIRRHYLKSSTLTLTQTSILSHLREHGPARAMELATLEDVLHPTMKLRIDRLEALGLVKRQPDRRDPRVVQIAITPRGIRTQQTAVDDVLAEMLNELSASELRRLEQALRPVQRLVGRRRNEG